MCCKGRVIAAAMLRVKHKRDVKHPRFKRAVRAVRPQNAQQILRSGKRRVRRVYVQALSLVVMIICLVAVYRQHWEQGDQLQALTQNIRDTDIISTVVIGIKRQNTARKRVHHITARRFHNNITHKACRKGPVTRQKIRKVL